MKMTEQQLRLAIRETMLREGFIDKIMDFFGSGKADKTSGTSSPSSASGKYRFPNIVDYLYQDPKEPKIKGMQKGGDATDEEWQEWYEENKYAPLKKNAEYVKRFIKELQGILGEARQR